MNVFQITSPAGSKGLRIIGNDGVEIEIIKNRYGTATLEIKAYDDEGTGTTMGVNLNRKELMMIVELLEPKLHAMKRPKELYNKETAR
jgi:hypothetical protein